MTTENQTAFELWQRLKPDAEFAVSALSSALSDPDASAAAVLDSYLFTKRVLAESMQSLLRSQLPVTCSQFRSLWVQIEERMQSQYSGVVPDRYLQVIYKSQAHEELFAVLHREIGRPVDAARLRTINRDDVHTERRVRELRELGLDIDPITLKGNAHYILKSLEVNNDRLPGLVVKAIRKRAPENQRDALAARIVSSEFA